MAPKMENKLPEFFSNGETKIAPRSTVRSKAASVFVELFPCRKENDNNNKARLKTHIITIHLYHNSYHIIIIMTRKAEPKEKSLFINTKTTNTTQHWGPMDILGMKKSPSI